MKKHYVLPIFLIAMLAVSGGMANAKICDPAEVSQLETISMPIPVGDYAIERTDEGCVVSLQDFGHLLVPGKPKLPSRIFSIAVPPGACVVEIDFETGEGVVMPGTYDVRPVPLPRVIGDENPAVYQRDLGMYNSNLELVYGSDAPYPQEPVEFVRTAGLRHYNLVDVRVMPLSYRPESGQLTYYPDIQVLVTFAVPNEVSSEAATAYGSERTERTARDIILNYDEAGSWYSRSTAAKGLRDYVIITLESLVSSVAPLVDWEATKGRSVEVVTTEWIAANYDGYDLAERMRNFLRDKYPSYEWGIEDVLLVGHYDNVRMRRCYQDVGYGKPETDFYYAELSLPDSLSWDSDQDHRWGENTDVIDFYPEVRVGRIPWSDPSIVLSICEKSVAYEQNTDPSFKNNILLLGAYFWADTDNAVMMEQKIDQPWMSGWSVTRLYEQNIGYWSTFPCDYPLEHVNVMSTWTGGQYAFVNWAGHGSPGSTHILGLGAPAFISSGDCDQLNDSYPAIIFADACSNSDTDYLNIGQAMMRRGAVAFVGATKVAYGCPAWADSNDGSSQSLDYFFTTRVTSGEYTAGEAHQAALLQMYIRDLWDDVRYEAFEWGSLWGNPNLGLGFPGLTIRLPEGVPEQVESGDTITIPVQISEGLDQYIPGTASVHYRYDGGDYQSSALVQVDGALFEATLPVVECGDLPQFYFSAEAESSGTVLEPPDAPDNSYSVIVGELVTLFDDDFESDKGWTIENDQYITDGQWDRGVPAGGGDRGDPPTDYDQSGACYLTDNVDGDSDVDNGKTSLISPIFDLSNHVARISYARWYSNMTGDGANQDVMEVRISSNGGSDWNDVETVGPVLQAGGGWYEYAFWVNDVIEPTSQVRVRFEVSDLLPGSVVEAGVDYFRISAMECQEPFVCGDANADGAADIDDVVYLVGYIFSDGPEPVPYDSGDADCSGTVDIDDAVYLINFIFSGGPTPCDLDGDGSEDC